MSSVIIVNAAAKHVLPVLQLEQKTFSYPCTESILNSCLDKSYIFKAAVKNDILVGYVIVQTVLDEGYFFNIAVSEDERGRGIGNLLMNALDEEAKIRQLAFLTLEVRAGNESAIRMYLKHGYTRVGLRKNYYEAPKEDAVIMTKYFK